MNEIEKEINNEESAYDLNKKTTIEYKFMDKNGKETNIKVDEPEKLNNLMNN
jgi:hypothetical protein